jgi:transcriptional regulator with XRE-family HTH domain
MKELNISKCIIKKRKEKGITQKQLANYIGVSKASVSKWESGHSYPDILFLPEIATYFNITVDVLIGYSPQLTKEYYSCFPFLLTMVQLLLNHFTLTDTEENKKALLQKCIFLCQRVKNESDVADEISQANSMEAVAEMFCSNFTRVIDLLDSTIVPYSGAEICQVNLYQKVISILSLLTMHASMHMSEPELFETIYQQGRQIIKLFDLKNLVCNSVAGIHIVAAQSYILQKENKKAIYALEEYVDTVCGYTYPLKIRGNSYFSYIDE